MEIFDFKDYKTFIRKIVAHMPKRGRGIYRQLGIHLGLNSVVISQIFKGTRDLTVEQALMATEFFSLTSLETDYFVTLVQQTRAGDHKLKKFFETKLVEIRDKSQKIKNRVAAGRELSLEAKSVYYSSWVYSGIKIASSLLGGQTAEQIASGLGLPVGEVLSVLDFLFSQGVLRKEGDRYVSGIGSTHLDADSPLVKSHHKNWRIKSIERMSTNRAGDLFATFPCSLSEKDFEKFRNQILKFIEEYDSMITPSSSEVVACFNIDWFRFSK